MSRHRRVRGSWRALLALGAAGVVVWFAAGDASRLGLGQAGGHTTGEAVRFEDLVEGGGDVAVALADVEVRPEAEVAGFDRDLFGPSWSDDVRVAGGHDGCDTRNDVLRRDLDGLVVQQGTRGCVALSGTLTDPYTGTVLPFERGEDSGSQIHVDHLVSLGDAWASGARELSPAARQDLANDPLNLWAVDGRQNQAKSDAAADGWLPTGEQARCRLVAHQVAVKARYGLSMTPAEREAIARVLARPRCEDQSLPTVASTRPPAPRTGEGR